MKNTSNVQTEVSVEQTTKKEWVSPMMDELNLNKTLTKTEALTSGPSKS